MNPKNISILLLISLLVACTKDFEEINTNPNSPTIDQANPALILPKVQYEIGNEMTAGLGWGLGNIVVQLVATNNFTGNDIYNWGTYSGTWNLMYRNLRDVQNLQTIGEQRQNENLQGVALVLKSWIFSTLTEMYGDIPYTNALKGKEDAQFTPDYTLQQDIYTGILADYEKANNLFASGQGEIEGDLMYGGDVSKWRKLTNSLRLRTLMRLENKWSELGIDGAGLMKSIIANDPIIASNADNAVVNYLSARPNQWPLHSARVGSFDEKRMSRKVEMELKAIDDPRVSILYRPVDNPDSIGLFRGVQNGLSEDNASNYNGGAKNQSRLGTRFREEPAAVEMVTMLYPEVQFILAEAAEKGYIDGGSTKAEAYYLNGINATMDYYRAVMDNNYLTQEGVAYNKNSSESKLELIAKQKWLSLFMIGLEGWFDWRRTGLPTLTPGPNALFDEVPIRIQYPGNEQVLNSENLDAAIGRQGSDEIMTKMWLLK